MGLEFFSSLFCWNLFPIGRAATNGANMAKVKVDTKGLDASGVADKGDTVGAAMNEIRISQMQPRW